MESGTVGWGAPLREWGVPERVWNVFICVVVFSVIHVVVVVLDSFDPFAGLLSWDQDSRSHIDLCS